MVDNCGPTIAADLSGHRFASVFSSERWIEALTATYGFNIKASTRVQEGETRAAIFYSEISDIRGERVVSLPFSDYCDAVVESEAEWQELIAPILSLQVPVRFRTVFNDVPHLDRRFTQEVCALWHGVDLRRPEGELWNNLKDTARRNIKRAQKHGVTIREGKTIDDVQMFYRLHCHVRKSKYRLLAQPFSFFENIHASFAADNRITVLLAELDGVAIAGILFLIHGDILYYKFNASIDLEFRPNDLLAWSGILLGRNRGLSRLDFGLSDLAQPGLIAFKRKFATDEKNISQMQWSPIGYVNSHAQQTGKVLSNLTQILTAPEVPDSVARASSELLYRYFC
jgi:CelD/BcsL family acetyltransferase involved in cellulose biosynthesis